MSSGLRNIFGRKNGTTVNLWLLYKISIGRRAVIGIKYTVRHTVQLAFYGTTGLIVGVTGLTLFENQLPLDYRNRIDHLKTQFLTNDIFEEHRIVLNIFGQRVDRLYRTIQGQRSSSDR